jgi:hypothetical protein
MVLAVVTELPLQLHAVEPDPFLDPPASDDMGRGAVWSGAMPPAADVTAHHAAADIGVTGTDEGVLTCG